MEFFTGMTRMAAAVLGLGAVAAITITITLIPAPSRTPRQRAMARRA